VYVDWSYTSILVVEDDATTPNSGMTLARIYVVGDVLDHVKLQQRNKSPESFGTRAWVLSSSRGPLDLGKYCRSFIFEIVDSRHCNPGP
jgi:hypothetical protein